MARYRKWKIEWVIILILAIHAHHTHAKPDKSTQSAGKAKSHEAKSAKRNPCRPNPCGEHGRCMTEGSGHFCLCEDGYVGDTCECNIGDLCGAEPCCHGSCTSGSDGSGYSCTCEPGYTGPRCGTGIDECSSSPCQHGGTCIDATDAFVCKCREGFTGDLCQSGPPSEGDKVCKEKPEQTIIPAGSYSMNQFAGFDDCINKYDILRTWCVGNCEDEADICQGVKFKRIGNTVQCDRDSADPANWKEFPSSDTVITKCGCEERGGNNIITERSCALRKRVVNRGNDDIVICGKNCENAHPYTLPYCAGECDDRLVCGIDKGSYKSIAVLYDCDGVNHQVVITMSIPTACDCN